MKLLFDQNLSHRLVTLLAPEYPGSEHVREVGLSTADDSAIWQYAARQGLTIVSKDSDFFVMTRRPLNPGSLDRP
jgi:predicted nuclease of predicted toxin-antitoxin system